jgi:hypothetical protein
MAQVKVVVSRGDVRVELEGDQAFVESNLEKLLPMVNADGDGRAGAGDRGAADDTEQRPAAPARQTIKSFFQQKSPGNASEGIAVALHYKRQYEQKDELTADEIRAALIQGGHRPPDQMAQALTDCRRRYGYVEAGTKKGFWSLTHQGETLVEIDLPRSKKAQ